MRFASSWLSRLSRACSSSRSRLSRFFQLDQVLVVLPVDRFDRLELRFLEVLGGLDAPPFCSSFSARSKQPLRGIELKGEIVFLLFELLIGHAPACAGGLPERLLPPLQPVLLQLIAALSLAIHLSLRYRGERRPP
jgi:hypothetical protein